MEVGEAGGEGGALRAVKRRGEVERKEAVRGTFW